MEMLLVPELSKFTPGVKRATSEKSLMPRSSRLSWVSAVTLIGTLLETLLAARGGDDDFLQTEHWAVSAASRLLLCLGSPRQRSPARSKPHPTRQPARASPVVRSHESAA